jgi:hypothetical protein
VASFFKGDPYVHLPILRAAFGDNEARVFDLLKSVEFGIFIILFSFFRFSFFFFVFDLLILFLFSNGLFFLPAFLSSSVSLGTFSILYNHQISLSQNYNFILEPAFFLWYKNGPNFGLKKTHLGKTRVSIISNI